MLKSWVERRVGRALSWAMAKTCKSKALLVSLAETKSFCWHSEWVAVDTASWSHYGSHRTCRVLTRDQQLPRESRQGQLVGAMICHAICHGICRAINAIHLKTSTFVLQCVADSIELPMFLRLVCWGIQNHDGNLNRRRTESTTGGLLLVTCFTIPPYEPVDRQH